MTSLEWGRLHGVNVDQLDADHGVIASLLVQLDDAIETDQSHDIVSNIVAVIGEFTDHHMMREAAVWTAQGIPPMASHTEDHAALVRSMNSLTANLLNGIWSLSDDLSRIRPVLNAHIYCSDGPASHHPAPSSLAPIVGGLVNGA